LGSKQILGSKFEGDQQSMEMDTRLRGYDGGVIFERFRRVETRTTVSELEM